MSKITVYIASPYSNGWMPENIRLQLKTADKLMDYGYAPYVPLLAHFQEIYNPRSEQEWLEVDFIYVKLCDALLRLKPKGKDGKEIPSPGATKEEVLAKENNIPVFYSIEDLNEYFNVD